MDVPGSKRTLCLSSFCPLRILGGAWQSKRKAENFSYVNNRKNWAKYIDINATIPFWWQCTVQLQSCSRFWITLDQRLSFFSFFLLLDCCRLFSIPTECSNSFAISSCLKESSCMLLMGDSDLSVGWDFAEVSFKKSLLRQANIFPHVFFFFFLSFLDVSPSFSEHFLTSWHKIF